MRLEKSATVLFFCHTERCGTHCVPNFQHLTFAECALYFASRNNNNWTTEWTTNKRHISAGKSVGIKRLQKKARRSSHPDHFFAKKMVNEDASLLFTLLCNKSSSLKNEVFLHIFTNSGSLACEDVSLSLYL